MLHSRRTLALSILAVLSFFSIPATAGALTVQAPTFPQLTDISALKPTHMNISIGNSTYVTIETKNDGTAEILPAKRTSSHMPVRTTESFPSLNTQVAFSNTQRIRIVHRGTTPLEAAPTQETPSRTPTPTAKPTATNTPIVTRVLPTATPTPTLRMFPTPTKSAPTPIPTKASLPTSSVSLDEKQQFIMNAINDYRHQNGLSDVHTEHFTCDFAQTRAQEIVANFNHDGFTKRMESKTLPYPGYTQITENIAMTGDYHQVVQMWINSPGHAENMRKDTPNVCVASSGDYYAYEGWKP